MTQEKKIEELQILEQNIQGLLQNKQKFSQELIEIENALTELKTSKTTFKIVNSIMFEAQPEDLKKELTEKKEIIDVRIKTIEKEEDKIRKTAEELQKEVMKELKH
tara:strand:- start:466 stop:783 length:318 start_codon:yes stop_codon:yes gene_type:complete